MDKKIKRVLLLGSGALQIGQAGEFDYSGSQAIKALKEENIEVILINPNIATIQTSENFATRVYFLPVDTHFVEEVIKKEKPDGILLSFGGQTALNCGLELENLGIFKKHKVKVLGTPTAAIETTEDRQKFADLLRSINLLTPQSHAVNSVKLALSVAQKFSYPVMIRSGYSLGGQDSGVVYSKEEVKVIASKALAKTSQILIEESVAGWKEIEYEVVRDKYDNCITVCNMENIDPMGIHTGESVVVAPSQTLNNYEYHKLRQIAIKVVRKLGIVGECNIQYALNPKPKNGKIEYRIIEVNARLSRSSALASKATGYPLAYVAAKLALGYGLTEIKNSVTRKTIACFEPALDYIVVKFPRWDLGKFVKSQPIIGSSMQSVGEVMAVGRNFEETIQKAARMLDMGSQGIIDEKIPKIDYKLPTPWRLFKITEELKRGTSVAKIAKETHIDAFFISKLKNIADFENVLSKGLGANIKKAKQLGFSDKRIAKLTNSQAEEITALRSKQNIHPYVKQIDTLAAEYPAETNYLYLTYNAEKDDVSTSQKPKAKSVIVLGSGPYRIGSSVEFDWCSVTCAQTAKDLGYSTIIINCNPETVSTDYDMADKLYFDELTAETVFEIYKKENPTGVIVSVGGQTPNNLSEELSQNGVKILGTSQKSIDSAEDRNKFSKLCDKLGIDQPKWAALKATEDAIRFAQKIGFPVLVRPSYVLSGVAFNIALDKNDLKTYLEMASQVSDKYPVVISKYIENAKEIEIDAVAQYGKILTYAISEHVENAGVHSGDATLVLPSQKVNEQTKKQIMAITQKIASNLAITGPFNIQFLAKENKVMVIECNLRASRSFPFVSKVTGVNFIKLATKTMLTSSQLPATNYQILDHVGVKAPQFSFTRIKGADPVLRVEMSSTGEVATFGKDVWEAFLKSQMAIGIKMPKKSVFASIGGDENKERFLETAKILARLGLKIYATSGTSAYLKKYGILTTTLFKIHENKKPTIIDYITSKKVDMVINIFDPYEAMHSGDGYKIRRATLDFGIPLLTNLQNTELFIESLSKKSLVDLKPMPWNSYINLS
ncbi:carbamoyl-phosphate synthase (glutamine-hydrolyzing) large subunit [Candidatus Curtissbacteria bacterium]|nr:carbamoyl-phosphate synthase (glutamine-hydrolyzing) large subunit [Candidatus Curtissbacteria bacterium]